MNFSNIFVLWVVGLICYCLFDVSMAGPSTPMNSQQATISFTINAKTDSSVWIITPQNPPAARIQIIFQTLTLVYGELRIYDTKDSGNGILLLNCVSCGPYPPPPFYSATGSVTISVRGVDAGEWLSINSQFI